ncbi:MAG: hypothetical protein GX358_00725 [candidate division WS1 bacterium]|nr:hypothetical protein [candidate division WS1 bacterium]
MSRIMKAGQIPEHEEVRPLSRLISPPGDKPPYLALNPPPVEPVNPPQAEQSSVQVSAESLQRTQRLLCDLITSLSRQRSQLLQDLKPAMIRLIMDLVGCIVERELEMDDTVVTRMVERALVDLGEEGAIVVRVCPEDAQVLRQTLSEGTWLAPVRAELEIVADVSIARGGCILHSDYGQVDASIPTQMAELERVLLDDGLSRE